MGVGPTELFVIILIAVVLFGARKIPELAKGLGEGIREFKKASREIQAPDKADTQKPQITSAEKKD